MSRIYILGAAGSGTSTLGSLLARRLGVPHTDADSLYWLPTDPPFTTPRSAQARDSLLLRRLPISEPWVFSGATTGWTTPVERHYDLVVFLRLEAVVRMARLRQREASRYGARILHGGDMAEIHEAFIARAEAYDTARSFGRGLMYHEAWLADQRAPVLRLDSFAPVEELIAAVLAVLRSFPLPERSSPKM